MANRSLQEARLKVDRARTHVDALKADIQRWIDHQNATFTSWTVDQEFDATRQCMVLKVATAESPPSESGLILGDAVANLRASLNYLAWALVRIGTDPTPQNPKSVQFPIQTDPDHQKSQDAVRRLIPGILPHHLAVIERHQPLPLSGASRRIRWRC
jgi:hypothetical protein